MQVFSTFFALIFAFMRIAANIFAPLFLVVSLLAACNNPNKETTTTDSTNLVPATVNYTVVKTYPHDTTAYTEGFLFHDSQLFESTGTEAASMPGTGSLFGTVDLT